jgi:hypothetical protein
MAGAISHLVDVRDKPGFLRRMMFELASGNAQMSLEGDLSRCRFTQDVTVTDDETAALKRNTIAPRQEFVVLRLIPEACSPILGEVMTAGLNRAIIHVQIMRDDVLELGAYDNFHRECVVTGPGISPALLDELKSTNVLRDFKVATRGR